MAGLAAPEDYIDDFRRVKEKAPLATLELRKKKNKHPESDGRSWGWYEISPLDIEVGYWIENRRDDLAHVDLEMWNRRAKELTESYF